MMSSLRDLLIMPLSAADPCGDDLSYDTEYTELERQAAGTPEQQAGDTVIEAEEPNWREIRERCLKLFERTRDLRVAMYLTLAQLCLDGLGGFRDGLFVLDTLVEEYWETVWPRLDPEDDNDPLERVNIIASLSPPPGAYQDPMMFLQRLREAPLCRSAQMGTFGLREILIASGEMEVSEPASGPDMALVNAAFQDTDIEQLRETSDAARESLELVGSLDAFLVEKIGASAAPDLSRLQDELREIHRRVGGYLERRGYGQAPQDGAADAAPSSAPGGDAQAAVGSAGGQIRTRADVLQAMDRICEFYESNEPSSPVPLIVRRAKRLATMSFVDILRDLTPEAVEQAELVLGRSETDYEEELSDESEEE